ncbi:MAG: hypothetical protein R6X22_06275 [Gemmatimonadota bacterium]|jgi:hypothetical protein
MQIDLTADEHEILRQVLEDSLSDLRMEIADTDLYDFREMLKLRKAAIVKLIEAMKAGEPVA